MAAIKSIVGSPKRDPCEFRDKLGDILRKTEVSFVSCHVLYCGNAQLGLMYSIVAMHNLGQLGPTEIVVSLSFSYSEILVFLETNLRF